MHLIVHNQTIESKKYIRILALNNVKAYHDELELAYGASDTTLVRVFYNCGDMCQRLINDLGFKKFKGINLKEINTGLWCIETCPTQQDEWFTQTYIEWIQKKLSSYIEDAEDAEGTLYYTIIPEEIQWRDISTLKHRYTCIEFGDSTTLFKIYDYELYNDKIVLTKEHLLSLIYKFVNSNYNFIASRTLPTAQSPINIDTTSLICGCCIDKDALNSKELLYLFSILGINDAMFDRVIKSKTYLYISESEILRNISSAEWNPYDAWYSYLDTDNTDNTDNICANSIETMIEPVIEPIVSKNVVPNKIIYKNTLNNEIAIFDKNLMYFTEFTKVAPFNYTTQMTGKIVESIDKTIITQEFINELKQFVAIFDTDDTSISPPPPPSTQKDLTQIYVDKYKNDTLETLASTVIDNVYQYLDGKITTINRNQIGKDLSEMGVKKNRKARGYVYGIEDTTKNYILDYCKASKELRETVFPSGPVAVSPWLQPGRFLMKTDGPSSDTLQGTFGFPRFYHNLFNSKKDYQLRKDACP
jgi:hypothetical protein